MAESTAPMSGPPLQRWAGMEMRFPSWRRPHDGYGFALPPPPPSIDIVASLARFEREMQEQRWDAVDAKAGVVLGFGGVIAALVASLADWWFLPSAITATVAVAKALRSLNAGDFVRQDPEACYWDWAALPRGQALWQAYSDELRTIRINDVTYEKKVDRLMSSWRWLVGSVILLAAGVTVALVLQLV
jgi:hypothetical protein